MRCNHHLSSKEKFRRNCIQFQTFDNDIAIKSTMCNMNKMQKDEIKRSKVIIDFDRENKTH